jgi:hypothetical protein
MTARPAHEVTIVTGLPRSGTSMLMQMLAAGGLPVLVDNRRPADIDNLRGYFEYEPVKSIGSDNSWLDDAIGRAVKVVAPLLLRLPLDRRYNILFMRRKLDAVLRSQDRMLRRRGYETDDVQDWLPRLAHLEEEGLLWCAKTANCRTLHLQYEDVVAASAEACQSIRSFLARELDLAAMAATVERTLA